jgi:glycosyltransferase involved in cell wall biosynthesis
MPTVGEGFCLPGLQSMALKVPVIITNFSGCQDYANKETATLIEPQGFILQRNMDSIPQFRDKKWAFISIEDLREKMRYVFTNYDIAENKALCAYDYVRDNFNYNKIENIFYEMLGSIYGI